MSSGGPVPSNPFVTIGNVTAVLVSATENTTWRAWHDALGDAASVVNESPAHGGVLIVDDDVDGVEALRYLLERCGFRVDVATNGAEALDYFAAGGRPCIVVLDLLMPVMDGIEFLERRKTNPVIARTPVVVVTASETRLTSRAEIVLRKPVDIDRLIERIRAVCRQAHGLGGV